ncbi:MAG: hypothetical protein NT062_13980 [Proteobacteria bacterium]|nr:hypothetical protein [Pseudomonadota bacterium]
MKSIYTSLFITLLGCTTEVPAYYEDQGATEGASIVTDDSLRLSGCHGTASSAVPADGRYTITTFGGPGDHQAMSCGGYADGTGWYAASRQRYGCAGRVKIEANGKCAVVETKDYGPDACVERAAGMPIIDVSPKVSRLLFGEAGAGWSDHLVVTVTAVDAGAALDPCVADAPTPTPDPTDPTAPPDPASPTTCTSATLGRDVADGVCVRSASDGAWFACDAGAWVARASDAGCAEAYGYCASATLGESVPARTCVQSAATGTWYQCNGQGWVAPVSTADRSGPIGDCASWHAN